MYEWMNEWKAKKEEKTQPPKDQDYLLVDKGALHSC